MAICVPCQPQSLIGLRLLTFVASHIGGEHQSNITSNHLILLENVKNAATQGSPWWTVKMYHKHTSDLEWFLKDWHRCTGLLQFVFHPSVEVTPENDVALRILQVFYQMLNEAGVGSFWALKRCNMEAQERALEILNAAIYGVTGELLMDALETGDDQGIIP